MCVVLHNKPLLTLLIHTRYSTAHINLNMRLFPRQKQLFFLKLHHVLANYSSSVIRYLVLVYQVQ